MSIFIWQRISELFSRNREAGPSRHGVRLLLETLEDRCQPSVYNPTAVPLLTVLTGTTSTAVNVATFASADPVGDLSAQVDWPAGATTVATTTGTLSNIGTVFVPGIGNATEYSIKTTFTAGQSTDALQPQFSISIHDSADGTSAQAFGTIQVLEVPLTAGAGVPPTTVSEGFTVLGTAQLFDFSGSQFDTPSDFNATIDWGDGSPETSGIVGQFAPGSFFVQGGHTYSTPGTATIVITVQDLDYGGSTLVAEAGPVTVTEAAITAETAPALNATEGTALTNVVVAQFTDADALAQPGDFAASVTNWGDGTSSAGTVVETSADSGGAHFDVEASHTFTAPLAAASITVTIQDLPGTETVTGTTALTVNAGALLITPSSLVVTKGSTIPVGTIVGSFLDAGGADPLANYAASVSFPGADASVPLNLIQNGNSFTLTTVVAASFVNSGGGVQAGNDIVTVSDIGANTAMAVGVVKVMIAPVSITTTSLANWTQHLAGYDQTVAATGGASPLTFSVSTGALPSGLHLNANSGAITGTPTTVGSSTFAIKTRDSVGSFATHAYTVTINAPVAITTSKLAGWTQNIAGYSQTVATTGGTSPLTFSIAAGALPTGLTLNTSSGALTGTPATVGSATFTIKAQDSVGSFTTHAYTITINAPVAITTTKLTDWTQNIAGYTQTVATTGGTSPRTFSVSAGALPSGLHLSASSGVIAGTPTTVGSSTFTIKAQDSVGSFETLSYTVTINAPVSITTTSLATWTRSNAGYSQTLAATGGTGSLQFSVSAGALPSGLSLNPSSGAITGTPTMAGSSTFTIKVRDSVGSFATHAYTVKINASVAIITMSLVGWTQNLAGYSQTVAATGGTGPLTFSIAAGALPTGLSLNTSSGVITGTPTNAGSSTFTIEAQDGVGSFAKHAYTVKINAI